MTKDITELKIMTKKRFIKAVEELVSVQHMTYMEAMAHIVESRGMEYSVVKRLLDDSLKAKLEQEAIDTRQLKTPKRNTLPGME